MNAADTNLCLEAFNRLCEELNTSTLLNLEECQYWVFERGYKAAVDEMINNISVAAKSQGKISLEEIYLAKQTCLH
jgi:hypothetical protein